MQYAPDELIEVIRQSERVFIKTDNYVPAHITASEGKNIGEEWDVERMRDYLYGEAALNKGKGTVSIFIGDAKYHSWIMHYQVTLLPKTDNDWSYEWNRIR